MTIRLRRRPSRRFGHESDGAAMVEFAIIAPLLFLLIFGIIDFGRVFFLYNNLTNAAREGARLGAVLDPTTQTVSQRSNTIRTAVKARINSPAAVVAACSVAVSFPGVSPGQTALVKIIAFPFQPVTFLAIKSSKTLNVTAEFRLEFQ